MPGLVAAAVGVGLALLVNRAVPALSPLTACVILGVLVGNLLPAAGDAGARAASAIAPGLRFAAKKLLRVGIVLLGLRLAVPDVLGLGWPTLLMVLVLVALTFFGTQLLGRWLGLSPGTSRLMATGFAICGVSAIAAMDAVTDNEESDVAASVAMVTLFGSLAIVVLPLLRVPLGLDEHQYGIWVGASVHDVAQTVAAASVVGASALAVAVVVKLCRVVLLAPMVAGMSLFQRSRRRADDGAGGTPPPPVPLFVLGFLAMIALRSTGWLPQGVVDAVQQVETILLAAALLGLGFGVHLPTLVRTGGRVAVLGVLSWVLIAAAAYGGVLVVT